MNIRCWAATMKLFVHSPNVKYAVIQVSSEPHSPERLVLAYRNEQSLHDFIAEPSIIARGFARPNEAAAFVTGDFAEPIAPKVTGQELPVSENRKWHFIFHSWKGRLAAAGLGGWKHRNLAYNAVQFALASAVLALYSKNVVSSVIRIILGI